jgi:GT2 family glycosyltransferase
MIVRRGEFLTFGGFDEDYFMYFEDVDLCWRYWLYGKGVAYVPASVVYHKFGGTGSSSRHSALRVFYGTRNSLLNMTKNYGARSLLFAFPLTLLYHLLKTLYFVMSLQGGAALAMIKAHNSFIGLLPRALDKRRAVQRRRTIGDRVLFDRFLIDPLSRTLREFLRLLRT